jgi:hypothetical protein
MIGLPEHDPINLLLSGIGKPGLYWRAVDSARLAWAPNGCAKKCLRIPS